MDPKQIVDDLIREAVDLQCSDIHLQIEPPAADVFFRIDGVLQKQHSFADEHVSRIGNRIMYLAGLKTYNPDLPQEGRIDGKDIDVPGFIRISTYPTVEGLRLALRFLNDDRSILTLDNLGFADDITEDIVSFLKAPEGAMLLTGPSGSGKTTTIYACLQKLLELGHQHIVTIEDPVECKLAGIMQTEVRPDQGLDFGEALKKLLRQDPDIIVIGEIRDPETAAIAFQAGLTGHKVISTVHAGHALGVVIRLLDFGIDPYVIAASLKLVIAQRLLRKSCAACGSGGCEACRQTDFQGRVPAAESLKVKERLGEMIREGVSESAFAACLAEQGFTGLSERARALIDAGITTAEEAARITGA